jgi:hypothetical protein
MIRNEHIGIRSSVKLNVIRNLLLWEIGSNHMLIPDKIMITPSIL